MKKLYYIRTNAYDFILSDDGEYRRVFHGTVGSLHAGFDPYHKSVDAALILSRINDDLDDSGWELFEETVEELTEDCEILATVENLD